MAVLQVKLQCFVLHNTLIHHLGDCSPRKATVWCLFNVLPLLSIHLHPPAQVHPQSCSPGWRPADLVRVPWPNTVAFTPVGHGVEHLLRLRKFLFGLYEWRLAPRELVVCNALKEGSFRSSLMTAKIHCQKASDPDWIWIPALLLTSYVTMGKVIQFPQVSHFTSS